MKMDEMFGFCCQWQRNTVRINIRSERKSILSAIRMTNLMNFNYFLLIYSVLYRSAENDEQPWFCRTNFTTSSLFNSNYIYVTTDFNILLLLLLLKSSNGNICFFACYSHLSLVWFPQGKYSLVAVVWNGDPINIDSRCLLMKINVKAINIKCMIS